MIRFGCPTCQHVLEVAPEQGGTKVRCTRCSQRIRVPTRQDLERTVPGKLLMGTAGVGTTALGPGEAAPPKPSAPAAHTPPPAAAPAKEPQWYYVVKGKRHGPFSGAQMAHLLGSGQLAGSDMVWTEGMPKWEPAQALSSRFAPVPLDKPNSGPLPAGLKPVAPMPTAPARPEVPRQAGVPVGLAIGGAGAVSAILAATVGVIVFLDNKPETTTETTTSTQASATTTELPLGDIGAKSKPALARVHLSKGTATGFLLNRDYVVTNWQPLADTSAAALQVSFPAGPEMTRSPNRAELVYVNPRSDLAILRINTTAASLTLADDFAPKGGEAVALAGFPSEQGEAALQTARLGVEVKQDNRPWYPLQGTLPAGYAGGPLLNPKGEVVGLACLYHLSGRAVPLADLRKALAEAQAAPLADQSVRNARHDATVVYRRILRSGTVHFEILDRMERRMQEAAQKGMATDTVYRDELKGSEQQRNEVRAPIKEAQTLYNQLLDGAHLPASVKQALVDFNGVHEETRGHLEKHRNLTEFINATQALAVRFKRARDQLQRELDLPPTD